ncbi:MAG: ROK family protein, partial [Planctomycetaceae bacterium]|nr:ROK family protein [Planctomycetaceae bacterium]
YGGDAPVSFQAIADAADAGDEMAREALRESARFFAIGIRNLMQSFDPELVLIQGEYAVAGRFFLEELRSRIPQTSLLGLGKCPRVEYSKLGPYGAIVGAANYAADIFFENA